jgi:imidazolonepropionase-like amidohydrolase
MDKGLIKGVGNLAPSTLTAYGGNLVVVHAKGAWVTPGIVDLHSHLGDASSPELAGAIDDNSVKGTIQPWLRSLDGLNTHDDSYALSVSGGVTTSLVLPGSANAIGKNLCGLIIAGPELPQAAKHSSSSFGRLPSGRQRQCCSSLHITLILLSMTPAYPRGGVI